MNQFKQILNGNLSNYEKLAELIDISIDVFVSKSSSKEERNIAGFIESWKIFGSKLIPYELWSDICEEGLKLLEKLLEDPTVLYKELPGFKEFDDKATKRARQLRNLGDPDIQYVMSEMECALNKKFSKKQLEEWATSLGIPQKAKKSWFWF